MTRFLTTFKNIKLTGLDTSYLELMPGVCITSSQEIRENMITDLSKAAMGFIETETMYTAKAFVFFEFEDDVDMFKQLTHLQCLEMELLWVNDILKNSWIFMDNCIICDTAFLIDDDILTGKASSLRLQYTHTMANGQMQEVEFTKEDWIECISIHNKMETYFHEKESGPFKFMLEKNFSRVSRALQFIKQAREARNIPYKITNYCTAMETLFTTENTELAHKLAERVAFFLRDKLNKLDTYKKIKKAYGIRSKLTHGASMEKKDIDLLPELSTQTDEILRTAFRKIIDDPVLLELFDSSNEKIDRYFEELMFS